MGRSRQAGRPGGGYRLCMAFRFAADRPAADEVLRMARAQTDAAAARLAAPEERGVAATIFDVRKRCKKARAVLRLVRGPMGETRYRRANDAYRDAGRALAGHRDAGAAALAFEWLLVADGRTAASVDVDVVRAGLAARREAAAPEGPEVELALAEARTLLEEASGRLDRLQLEHEGWELLGEGVADVYGRGARALRRALKAPTPDRLHELRKQVKYTRYHLRMLRRTSPGMVLPLLDGFESVGDHLGQARDLLLLVDAIEADPQAVGGDGAASRLVAIVDEQRAELEEVALGIARRLYAEEPDAFAARLGAYWDLWTSSGPEPIGVLGPDGDTIAAPSAPSAPSAAPAADPAPAAEDASSADDVAEEAPEPEAAPEPTPVVEVSESAQETRPALEELTVTALRALAREKEIVGRSRMNRAELIAVLDALH